MENQRVKYWVEHLEMDNHPEGGYYKETYRSSDYITADGFEGERSVATGIYFLLFDDVFSAFHRIKSDEMWHFYEGSTLEVLYFQDGVLKTILLGNQPEKGEVLQAVVPKNCWFGSRVKNSEGHALVGCTVAPGFDFQDFEMAKAEELVKEFPKYSELIEQMCR